MNRRQHVLAVTMLTAFLFVAPSVMAGTELTIGAAASLKDALTEAGNGFAATEKDVKVSYNFAATSALVQQIKSGAAIDVFVSADATSMDKVTGALAAGTRQDILEGELVLIVPDAKPALKITQLADLSNKDLKAVAVCDEAVPAGHYARLWLSKYKLLDVVTPRIVKPENVRAALALVATGVADAGFVYATDALLESSRVRIVDRATAADGIDVRYPAAALSRSKHPDAAKRFLAYLRTEPARAIFLKFGFKPL